MFSRVIEYKTPQINPTKYLKLFINIFLYFFLVLCSFFYIYTFSVPFLPKFLSSRRIVIVIITIVGFLKKKHIPILIRNKIDSVFFNLIIWNLFLLAYGTIIHFVFGSGSGVSIINFYINFILFGTAAYYGFNSIFKNSTQFFNVILFVSLIQSFIIILGVINKDFMSFINSTFNQLSFWNTNGNSIDDLINTGYAVGLASITSTGTFQLSLGLISIVYLYKIRVINFSISTILLIIITLASTLLARTGLILGFLSFLFLFMQLKSDNNFKFFIFSILGILVVSSFMFFYQFILPESLLFQFRRVLSLLEDGFFRFFTAYFDGEDTVIPKISLFTIIGTNTVSGLSGSNIFINADGGFIRSYFSMGLILSIINYFVILKNLFQFKSLKKTKKYSSIVILFILILLLGEFKEFFIYDIYFMVLFFTFISLEYRNNKNIFHN